MDADDLVQETAVKAYTNFDKFKSGTSFKNWSFTILRNTFITSYTKRKKKNIVSAPIEEMEFAIKSTITNDEHAASTSTIKQLKKLIDDLSGKSKKPFTMYINGYTYDEIAIYLKIPMGTVKSRINFARKKLKQNLQKK